MTYFEPIRLVLTIHDLIWEESTQVVLIALTMSGFAEWFCFMIHNLANLFFLRLVLQ